MSYLTLTPLNEKPWHRLFDFYFMISLLLANRVAVGIKAVLGSLIDRWEEGVFLDELVDGLLKPFIGPFETTNRKTHSIHSVTDTKL